MAWEGLLDTLRSDGAGAIILAGDSRESITSLLLLLAYDALAKKALQAVGPLPHTRTPIRETAPTVPKRTMRHMN